MDRICFLRHGEAFDDDGRGDALRELTERGVRQSDRAGIAISRLGIEPDCCLSSPRTRAIDTARGACAHLGIEPEEVRAIGEGAYDSLELAAGRGVVLIVGHEPFLSAEVQRLTGGRVRMKKGGLAVVGGNGLEFLSGPKGLRLLAERG